MDLNQLLHAHQIAAMGEARAPDRARRAAYADDVTQFAVRIRRLREDGGADVRGAPFVVGERAAALNQG